MRVNDVLADYSSRQPPKEDSKHLQMLADAIKANGHDMTKLIEMMAMLGKAIAEKNYSVEAPNVSVDFDMAPLIEAVKAIKMPEQERPIINVDTQPSIVVSDKEPCAYSFEMVRDNLGRVSRVIANPVGG